MSFVTIKNEVLTVTVDTLGATLHSIKKDGNEYLWQGDPASWNHQDVNLFPCVGRLYEGKYRFKGKEYPMTPHGFCKNAEFELTGKTDTSLCLTLRDNEQTRSCYPFSFVFHVRYSLQDNRITKTCQVENPGKDMMYFGLGSHPGFNIPLDGKGDFSSWFFEFPLECHPRRVCFDHSSWLLAPERPDYPLLEESKLPLCHALFDYDAIVLEGTPKTVTLRSQSSSRSVTVDFPQMPFIGFWHTPHAEANFVCIEPWLSLPSCNSSMEDLETQAHLVHLPGGETYENTISITLT